MGYRFSLDFLPLVFWLLMRSRVPMSGNFKGLILISTIIDLCLAVFFLATGVDRRQDEAARVASLPFIMAVRYWD